MNGHEFSLRKEVLLEMGASILGDLFYCKREIGGDERHPVSVMYDLIWSAKQDILMAKTETELARIEGQFELANSFLAGIEAGSHEG